MEKVEDKKTCFICRAKLSPSTIFTLSNQYEAKIITWEERCAETICEIFFGDPSHPLIIYFQNAAYCSKCQIMLWNLEFSWRQLLFLRNRVDSLSLSLRKLLMANFRAVREKSNVKIPNFEEANFYGMYNYDHVIQILKKLLKNGDALSGINVPFGRTPDCTTGNVREQERNRQEKLSSASRESKNRRAEQSVVQETTNKPKEAVNSNKKPINVINNCASKRKGSHLKTPQYVAKPKRFKIQDMYTENSKQGKVESSKSQKTVGVTSEDENSVGDQMSDSVINESINTGASFIKSTPQTVENNSPAKNKNANKPVKKPATKIYFQFNKSRQEIPCNTLTQENCTVETKTPMDKSAPIVTTVAMHNRTSKIVNVKPSTKEQRAKTKIKLPEEWKTVKNSPPQTNCRRSKRNNKDFEIEKNKEASAETNTDALEAIKSEIISPVSIVELDLCESSDEFPDVQLMRYTRGVLVDKESGPQVLIPRKSSDGQLNNNLKKRARRFNAKKINGKKVEEKTTVGKKGTQITPTAQREFSSTKLVLPSDSSSDDSDGLSTEKVLIKDDNSANRRSSNLSSTKLADPLITPSVISDVNKCNFDKSTTALEMGSSSARPSEAEDFSKPKRTLRKRPTAMTTRNEAVNTPNLTRKRVATQKAPVIPTYTKKLVMPSDSSSDEDIAPTEAKNKVNSNSRIHDESERQSADMVESTLANKSNFDIFSTALFRSPSKSAVGENHSGSSKSTLRREATSRISRSSVSDVNDSQDEVRVSISKLLAKIAQGRNLSISPSPTKRASNERKPKTTFNKKLVTPSDSSSDEDIKGNSVGSSTTPVNFQSSDVTEVELTNNIAVESDFTEVLIEGSIDKSLQWTPLKKSSMKITPKKIGSNRNGALNDDQDQDDTRESLSTGDKSVQSIHLTKTQRKEALNDDQDQENTRESLSKSAQSIHVAKTPRKEVLDQRTLTTRILSKKLIMPSDSSSDEGISALESKEKNKGSSSNQSVKKLSSELSKTGLMLEIEIDSEIVGIVIENYVDESIADKSITLSSKASKGECDEETVVKESTSSITSSKKDSYEHQGKEDTGVSLLNANNAIEQPVSPPIPKEAVTDHVTSRKPSLAEQLVEPSDSSSDEDISAMETETKNDNTIPSPDVSVTKRVQQIENDSEVTGILIDTDVDNRSILQIGSPDNSASARKNDDQIRHTEILWKALPSSIARNIKDNTLEDQDNSSDNFSSILNTGEPETVAIPSCLETASNFSTPRKPKLTDSLVVQSDSSNYKVVSVMEIESQDKVTSTTTTVQRGIESSDVSEREVGQEQHFEINSEIAYFSIKSNDDNSSTLEGSSKQRTTEDEDRSQLNETLRKEQTSPAARCSQIRMHEDQVGTMDTLSKSSVLSTKPISLPSPTKSAGKDNTPIKPTLTGKLIMPSGTSNDEDNLLMKTIAKNKANSNTVLPKRRSSTLPETELAHQTENLSETDMLMETNVDKTSTVLDPKSPLKITSSDSCHKTTLNEQPSLPIAESITVSIYDDQGSTGDSLSELLIQPEALPNTPSPKIAASKQGRPGTSTLTKKLVMPSDSSSDEEISTKEIVGKINVPSMPTFPSDSSDDSDFGNPHGSTNISKSGLPSIKVKNLLIKNRYNILETKKSQPLAMPSDGSNSSSDDEGNDLSKITATVKSKDSSSTGHQTAIMKNKCIVIGCGKTFRNPKDLILHFRIIHQNDNKPYHCEYPDCGKRFSRPMFLLRHKRSHKVLQSFECVECYKTFPTKEILKSHLEKHERLNPCRCFICFEQFPNAKLLNVHNEEVHKYRSRTEKKFKCSYCEHEYSSQESLSAHSKSHTAKENGEEIICSHCGLVCKGNCGKDNDQAERSNRPFTCKVCGDSFAWKFRLAAHLLRHMGESIIKCNTCGKVFESKMSLQVHESVHENETRKFCKVCGDSFDLESALEEHKRTVHIFDEASSSDGEY